jgi:hypothetical protein
VPIAGLLAICRHFDAYYPQKSPQSRPSDPLPVACMFAPFPCPALGRTPQFSVLATGTLRTEDSFSLTRTPIAFSPGIATKPKCAAITTRA